MPQNGIFQNTVENNNMKIWKDEFKEYCNDLTEYIKEQNYSTTAITAPWRPLKRDNDDRNDNSFIAKTLDKASEDSDEELLESYDTSLCYDTAQK